MSHAATAQQPWGSNGRIVPAGCVCPDPDAAATPSPTRVSPSSSYGRLVPLGSTCPPPAQGANDGASHVGWSRGLGGSVVPAGSTCPTLSEAAASRALELEHSWGLGGRLVPTGSTCLVVDGALHRERSAPVFSAAFLSSHRMSAHPRQATTLYAIVVHAILLTVVLLLPLWFTDTMDPGKFMTTLLVAPPQMMTAPSPPAAAPAQAAATTQPAVRRVFMKGNRLLFPTAIPKHAAMISEGPLEPEIVGGFGGVYGGLPSELGGELLAAMAPPPPPPPPAPPEEPVVEEPRQPLRVGGDVKPPKLIHQVQPVYPRLAKQARVQGDVVLSAIIDEKGEVVELKAISGPPMLFSAALDAVQRWKFEPTYLNGRPWPVAHEITIHFRL